MKHRIFKLIAAYPLPACTLFGILVGAILQLGFELPHAARIVWFATLIIGGSPIVFKTFKGILEGHFVSDIVAMLAILTAIIMDEAFAGAVVVLMQSGGEAIEEFGLRRATSTLKSLIERAPRNAHRKTDGHIERIDIESIRVGDILVVRTGDLIPVDGTIVQGESEIDESAITGEPLAHAKTTGDRLLSGTVAVNGNIEMRADKVSQESQYAKIIELVRKAQAEKAPIQRLADQYAIFFTPLALAMSALGFWITRDPTTILAVLVVATPCPLILATPLAVICGINKAADLGIIAKGGQPIEQMGKVRSVVFDKTGTLTFGTPFLQKIIPFDTTPEKELLRISGIIEQLSSHSVAKAIVDSAHVAFPNLPMPTEIEETAGRGVAGNFEGNRILVGSHSFLEEKLGKGILSPYDSIIAPLIKHENVLAFIARNQTPLGLIVLTDRIRPGVSEMVQRLYSLGIEKISLLTGDSKQNADSIALQAGIQDVKAELLPEQKVDAIHQLMKQYKKVVMVGDGINDAPALASSTVGIAMGAYGSAISAETADIVLLVDDPTRVADAIEIGRRMLKIAKQSIYIGIGLSFVLMIIAAQGLIPPPIGALLQEIIDVAVILNALRAR